MFTASQHNLIALDEQHATQDGRVTMTALSLNKYSLHRSGSQLLDILEIKLQQVEFIAFKFQL
jgi:hypothetical protein